MGHQEYDLGREEPEEPEQSWEELWLSFWRSGSAAFYIERDKRIPGVAGRCVVCGYPTSAAEDALLLTVVREDGDFDILDSGSLCHECLGVGNNKHPLLN